MDSQSSTNHIILVGHWIIKLFTGPINYVWKDRVFAIRAKACWLERRQHRFMCKHKLMMTSLLSLPSKLVLEVMLQDDASCCWVCHRKFHGILPKEQPGTFYEVPWGLYKWMSTNAWGQSDMVTLTTYIWNKEYCNYSNWLFSTYVL